MKFKPIRWYFNENYRSTGPPCVNDGIWPQRGLESRSRLVDDQLVQWPAEAKRGNTFSALRVTNMCDFEGELRREPTQSRYSRLSRTNQVRRRSDQCEVVRIPVNPAAAACYVVGRGPSAEFGLRYGIIEIRLISLATKLGIQT